MPLFIKDEEVNELAEQYQKVGGFKSKTEAVRKALEAQIKLATNRIPLLEQLEPILQQVDQTGQVDPDFDMKEFRDGLWGED